MAVEVNGGALEFDAVINAAQFNAAISSIERQLAGLTKTAERESSAIDGLVRKTSTAIAGYATFITSTNFIGDIVRVRGEFQQLEVAFGTMLGSKEKADKLMQQVADFAATTPFELQDVAKATKQLLAFGISSDNVIGTLRSLGDVSAGIGAPLGEIAYLFGTIKTQGVALTQDIRQFASRGIPIYEELAKVLGVNVEQVNDFISAGKVGFPQIQQVFENLTAEGSKFGGLMEAQSKTLTGQISNLRDAWNRMLNDIGKGQEGLFSDIIQGATYLVQNFDEVVKILKILVITYGSYKAAVLATTAVQAIATNVTKGYTIAETLRYQAMLLSERAAKLLNRTMLANPVVLVTTGMAALVASLVIFTKRTSEAQRMQKLLNDVQLESQKILVQEKGNLDALVKVAKDEALSKEQRKKAVEKLNEIAPEYLGNLTLENLKTAEGKQLLDEYVKALERKAKAQAINTKLTELDTKRIDVENEKRLAQLAGGRINKYIVQTANDALKEIDTQKKELSRQQEELIKEELQNGKDKNKEKIRTLEIIDKEIKAEKEKQQTQVTNAKDYQDSQKKINALEEEKKRITGETTKTTKATQVIENNTNALLERRRDILQQIADLVKQGNNAGQSRQESEIDRINKKYDELIRNIDEYNQKVEQFNAKNPKNTIQKIGFDAIKELNKARKNEISEEQLKVQKEQYEKFLQEQVDLFTRYENLKKEVGAQKAKELLGEQTKGFDNFVDFLKDQESALFANYKIGVTNKADLEKFKQIQDAMAEESKRRTQQEIDDEAAKYNELLNASATYAQRKAEINQKYDELEATLKKNSTIAEFEERKKLLEQSRNDELAALDSELARASDLYRKLNQDILMFSRERLKEEIKLLKAKLKTDTSLTPQQKADIQKTIDQYQGLLDETNKVANKFNEISDKLAEAAGAFSSLGDSLSGTNEGLSKVFNTLGDIASIGSQAAGAVASFASGNIIGGITKTIGVITSLFNLGKKARERRKKEQEELDNFVLNQFKGEQEINRLYRERALEQVKLNKLRIQGLNDERALLLAQKDQIAANYNQVFSELQKLTAKVRKSNGRGFTEVSLFGKSYEDLQKLFLSGQLEGKAKDLFELLDQLKQEGLDIDAALEENKRQAQELYTGTTADNISDAIIEGFKNGKRSISDFADTFEDLMRQAMIQSLKYKYLEGPLKEFFDQFAAASESDGRITSAEITQLREMYNTLITNATEEFQQLQDIAGINFGSSSAGTNSVTGVIKGMTEQQAELLAGQFGGLRITVLDLVAIGRQHLQALNAIQANTGSTVTKLQNVLDKMIYYYEVRGVKMY